MPLLKRRRAERAFTLLEVMIAVALFFMAAFSVLALVSQNLRAARSLQTSHITAAMLAAESSTSQVLVEGVGSGDFGELYPGFQWAAQTNEHASVTNGLYQIDYVVTKDGRVDSQMTIFLFRPNSVRRQTLR